METRWATFDCFGTLIDWRHGIVTSADLVYPGYGRRLLAAYNRHEPRVQAENPTMRYRRLLAETLRRAALEEGLEPTDDETAVLGDTIGHWPVFPDVHRALDELRADGWRLALLTNCDRDIIGLTQRRLRVPIDVVVTAEDVGAYKPAYRHFQRFAEAFEVTRDRWVHVAQSHFHDMVPAGHLGISRIWINRLDEQIESAAGAAPDAVLPGLDGLAAEVRRVTSR